MRSAQFIGRLNDAVRENPVAAGLIGIGVAWIVFGKSGAVLRDTAGAARAAKASVDTAVDATAGAVGSTMTGAADRVRKTAAGISDTVSSGLNAAASAVGGAVETGFDSVKPSSNKQNEGSGGRALSYGKGFAELIERQPLALAAVGIGIGAALASAFPLSKAEDQLMGSTGGKLKDAVKSAADTVVDKVAAAVDKATDEAVAQDLTPDALKDAARIGADKLRSVAEAGLETLKK